MLKFIRGHSTQSSTSSKLSTSTNESDYSTEEEQIKRNDSINLNLNDLKTNRILLEVKLNNVLHHKLLAKLTKKKACEIKFHKEASSLNSSCNDSVISSESTVSRCTSSCGERSSVSELELNCSLTSSDNEETNKYTNNTVECNSTVQTAPVDNNQQVISQKPNNKSSPINNDDQLNKSTKLPINQSNESTSQLVVPNRLIEKSTSQSFKVESKRRSILLSNQVTRTKSSISTTASRLLLPKDTVDSHECYSKGTKQGNNTMMKFFTYSMRDDVEYKTLSISNKTTSKQVINILLDKFKMKHRDSNLFYLTMEIIIRQNGIPIRSLIRLNNEACPVQLKACYPNDEIRFLIETKPGGLLRVYDSCLMAGSLYKSILVDTSTTVNELIQLMLNCYHSKDKPSNYSLFVVDKQGSYKLEGHELPLYIQEEWNAENDPIFQLRKTKEINYNYLNKVFLFKRLTGHSLTNISSIIFQDHFYI